MDFISIKSKADALVFAIGKSVKDSDFDKERAEEIYNYILSKVNLPDVEIDVNAACLNNLNEMVVRYGEALTQSISQ